MQIFHCEDIGPMLPAGHRFPAGKSRLLHAAVQRGLPGARLRPAAPASREMLLSVHTPGYVDAVLDGTLSPAQCREIGFPWSPRMAQRSCCSVGATVAAARAARAARAEGVAAQLAGGTHHAHADRGSGFCVFNDVAVAARLLQREAEGAALRVLVIDLDVHQGNGTAAIFEHEPSVFTLSLHGARNFPFRKARSDLDVELPDGCRDADYLAALDAALAAAWDRLGGAPPGIAFYLAGADVHEGDRLGRLKLSAAGMAARDRVVLDALHARGVPVALLMAGGYGVDLDAMVALQLGTLQRAQALWAARNR